MVDEDIVVDEYGMPPRAGKLADVPSFGIGHVTVQQAAQLATLDQWYSSGFEGIPDPPNLPLTEDDNSERPSPWLNKALAVECHVLERRLSASIQAGKLVAAKVCRDFDDGICADETWIDYVELSKWFELREHHLGDLANDWIDGQRLILNRAERDVHALQIAMSDGSWRCDFEIQAILTETGEVDESDAKTLAGAVKALKVENADLRRRLAESAARPPQERFVGARASGTMLRIIRALDVLANLPERGAAPSVQRQLEELGFTDGPGDTTIRNALNAARAMEPDSNPQ